MLPVIASTAWIPLERTIQYPGVTRGMTRGITRAIAAEERRGAVGLVLGQQTLPR